MEAFFDQYKLWGVLLFVVLGTYFWRALGVLLSGHVNQDGEVFKWLSAVTYAILGALTFKLILLPVGTLGNVSIYYRIFICIICLAIMLSKKGRLTLSLVTGCILIMLYDFF